MEIETLISPEDMKLLFEHFPSMNSFLNYFKIDKLNPPSFLLKFDSESQKETFLKINAKHIKSIEDLFYLNYSEIIDNEFNLSTSQVIGEKLDLENYEKSFILNDSITFNYFSMKAKFYGLELKIIHNDIYVIPKNKKEFFNEIKADFSKISFKKVKKNSFSEEEIIVINDMLCNQDEDCNYNNIKPILIKNQNNEIELILSDLNEKNGKRIKKELAKFIINNNFGEIKINLTDEEILNNCIQEEKNLILNQIEFFFEVLIKLIEMIGGINIIRAKNQKNFEKSIIIYYSVDNQVIKNSLYDQLNEIINNLKNYFFLNILIKPNDKISSKIDYIFKEKDRQSFYNSKQIELREKKFQIINILSDFKTIESNFKYKKEPYKANAKMFYLKFLTENFYFFEMLMNKNRIDSNKIELKSETKGDFTSKRDNFSEENFKYFESFSITERNSINVDNIGDRRFNAIKKEIFPRWLKKKDDFLQYRFINININEKSNKIELDSIKKKLIFDEKSDYSKDDSNIIKKLKNNKDFSPFSNKKSNLEFEKNQNFQEKFNLNKKKNDSSPTLSENSQCFNEFINKDNNLTEQTLNKIKSNDTSSNESNDFSDNDSEEKKQFSTPQKRKNNQSFNMSPIKKTIEKNIPKSESQKKKDFLLEKLNSNSDKKIIQVSNKGHIFEFNLKKKI